jgi:Flp pilus assembly CpaE family ATPase
MLNALIVTPDERMAAILNAIAANAGFLRVKRTLRHAPLPYELVRAANSDDIDLLFVDFVDADSPPFNSEAAESLNRWTGVIGFSSTMADLDRNPLPHLLQGWLSQPFTERNVLSMVTEVTGILRDRTEDRLVAVLPAKAGSGASTLALHLARAIGEVEERETLLLDGDLRSGVLATLLNQRPAVGLAQLLSMAADITPAVWNTHVMRLPHFHLLGAAAADDVRPPLPHWSDYFKLLRFLRPNYGSIVVDLPELVNEATAEVVRSAEHVLIVTTGEVAALTLASQRCQELEDAGVRPQRVGIVLNRWHRNDLSPAEVEKTIGRKVLATIPNNYRLVQAAAVEGGFVAAHSDLGRAYQGLAGALLRLTELAGSGAAKKGLRAWFG